MADGALDNTSESTISMGPWGSSAGRDVWDFMAKNDAVKQIIVVYGNEVIDSIMFKGDRDQYSKRFGGLSGNGPTKTEKVEIDFPSEYLIGVSGTYGGEPNKGPNTVLKSLRFYTNRTVYGAFGNESGTKFSFSNKGGIIVGFHGRSGHYVDSIGVYVKLLSGVFASVSLETDPEINTSRRLMGAPELLLVRTPGPWGGNAGRDFDDGVFSGLKQVHVHLHDLGDGNVVLRGVQFEYEKKDGTCIWGLLHGSHGNGVVKLVKIEKESDFVMGIEGFYGPVEGITGGMDVIRSITFHTSEGKYGPFGSEIGQFFSSMAHSGTVLGFFGKSGAYLNTIGVHNEYIFEEK